MNREFQVHKLTKNGIAKAQKIAEAFDACLEELAEFCPPGREMAIVRTKLEEACFFAKKAMASEAGNAEPGEFQEPR